MMRIKNELLRRTFFALLLIAVFVPTFVITKYVGTTGRIISAVTYMIVGMYAVFEVLVVLNVKRFSALLAAVAVPLFFVLPVNNFNALIKFGADVNKLSLLVYLALVGWEGWVIVLLFSLLPLVLDFGRHQSSAISRQLVITIVFFLLPAFTKLFWIYNIKGLEVVAFFILIAAISDAGGYFGGRFFGTKWFGGKKLVPQISPRKTYAGFVVGTSLAVIFTILYGYFVHVWQDFGGHEVLAAVLLGFTLPLVAVLGDLFFSFIKRTVGVKDFSNIIPGHGGLMDRLDAMPFVFLIAGFFLLFVSS